MNPNKTTWQDRAKELVNLSPLADQRRVRELRESIMLVNVHPSSITQEDYQLLLRALR